ncbi:stage II sporulation protein M [Coraliomargarita parva]|uniref:stage II sporulation protein M n=1 Tax=Coraliomargarita parva TaxID=3014050 RepID=UPI0022B342D0|nr:stage II sporulation protein M [Coraliomargarita parva]
MILDTQRFILERRAVWDEYEAMLLRLEADPRTRLATNEVQRFHYLYERVASDLSKLNASAVEPQTQSYLESLVARGFGEMHGTARRTPFFSALVGLLTAFPRTVRRHALEFWLTTALFFGGALFGAAALALDPDSKPVLMPFSHLLGDPSDRVAEEEVEQGRHMDGQKSTFSAQLMTNNIKVSIFALALGMTFGVGTGIVLFYNGVGLGAVAMDYILDGQSVFLSGWLLPHGSVEIPAILLAGQGGLILGRTLIFASGRKSIGARLQAVRDDLVTIISGVALMLVWAGIIESFLSQYHEPVIPYAVKITFGLLQLGGVVAYFTMVGRKESPTGK